MSNPSRDETLFLQLVAMFQYAAMQQMGKIPNPMTGKIERDLAQARLSIDMIEMLDRRTQAQRSDTERQYLEKVLFELRMNYVDESKRPAEPGNDAPEGQPDELQKGDGPEGA
ncbi:MAG TPA: DUF1844 domain-containing protein [Candidatus Krumholzibacteria bacterium]